VLCNLPAAFIPPLIWLAAVVTSVMSDDAALQTTDESTQITPRHLSSSKIGAATNDLNFRVQYSGMYWNRGSEARSSRATGTFCSATHPGMPSPRGKLSVPPAISLRPVEALSVTVLPER